MRRLYRTRTRLAVLAFILFWACTAFGKDIFGDPFGYLSDTAALPLKSNIGKWYVRAVALQSVIVVTQDAATQRWRSDWFSGTGFGVSWEREIVSNHKYYQSFAFTVGAMFTPTSVAEPFTHFSGCILFSTLDGWAGFGGKFDGKDIAIVLSVKGDLPL